MDNKSSLGDSLASRTISAFPLSIGTSLALESVFPPRLPPYDPAREIPTHISLNEYNDIWINLHTLVRNIAGAMSSPAFIQCDETELKDTLLMEMDVINSLFMQEGGGLCKPIYYFCTYERLFKRTPPQVKFRQDKTDFQKIFKVKMMKAIKQLERETEEIQMLDTEIVPKDRPSGLILTHIPYDLTSYERFRLLSLLESHTGKLKSRHEWNTKYYPVGDSDLSHLPFLRKLLMVFGDRALIHSSDYKLRKQIVDISVSRKWTPMTTADKVMLDFEIDIKEPYVLQFLRSL